MYILSQSITWSFEPHLPLTPYPCPSVRGVYIFPPRVCVSVRQDYMIFICVRVGESNRRRSLW